MNLKRIAVYLLDLMILLAAGASAYLLSREFPVFHPIILTAALIGIAIVLVSCEVSSFRPSVRSVPRLTATALVLLNDAQRAIQSWNLVGQTSMLLGKNIEEKMPAIDLANTEYSALINEQHAVLNYTAAGWIIEDLASQNGVGILHPGKEQEQHLVPGIPYKILPGDIVYIAGDTRLAVR